MATGAAKDPKPQKNIRSVKETPGIDILGTTTFTCIIRSDLGCYLIVEDLKDGTNSLSLFKKIGPVILNLHPHCTGGDHYFAVHHSNTVNTVATTTAWVVDRAFLGGAVFAGLGIFGLGKKIGQELTFTLFYVLKGNQYRVYKSLTTAEDSKAGELHPNCQGADFYMGTSEYLANSTVPIFIIIREKEEKFEAFSDLETGERSENYKKLYGESHLGPYELHKKCKGGLYYWATKSQTIGSMRYYILKDMDHFGVVTVHYTTNLRTDEDGKDISLHISLINFLPGGLTNNLKGKWHLLKQIGADKEPKPWAYKEMTKVGYRKETLHSVQHNWETKMKYTVEHEVKGGLLAEKVFSTSLKNQFSLEATYGGHVTDSTKETISEEKTTAVELSGEIKPGGTISIWQYVIMLCSENKILFATPHIQQTDSRDPPDYVPQMELKPEDMIK